MGRHARRERPDDEPVSDVGASQGLFYGAPLDPSYNDLDPSYNGYGGFDDFDDFAGPTDDRVYVSPHERVSSGSPQTHGPPDGYLFEPLPGDYPGDYPGAPSSYPATAPETSDPWSRKAPAEPARSRKSPFRFLSLLPVPLLPIVALVIAVGIVAYALSTQQISLNFAGGAPDTPRQTDPRDNQVSQRGDGDGDRASRGGNRTDGLIIAFRVASKNPGGFKATATIANKGAQPVTKWALAFTITTATVTAIKGATVVKTGKIAYVRGRTAIAPGQKVRVVFAAKGVAHKPSTCVLNSQPCAMV
ncbi:hypothetical protein GCM10022254_19650 [Actinomadura meridiana]|uniref:CBM2 domain-containing protein n=1 Tax=Actinomadura meridiana TaxID=559626 RepID=A0ABP8BWX9_9ACTN